MNFPANRPPANSGLTEWQLRYRLATGDWQTTRVPITTSSTDIDLGTGGPYEFEVSAVGLGGRQSLPQNLALCK